jgi:hypothetical protein
MDDIHDKLVKAYLEYFEKNEIWERKQSVRTYYAVQQCIRKVRDLAEARNKEIRHRHQTKKDKGNK